MYSRSSRQKAYATGNPYHIIPATLEALEQRILLSSGAGTALSLVSGPQISNLVCQLGQTEDTGISGYGGVEVSFDMSNLVYKDSPGFIVYLSQDNQIDASDTVLWKRDPLGILNSKIPNTLKVSNELALPAGLVAGSHYYLIAAALTNGNTAEQTSEQITIGDKVQIVAAIPPRPGDIIYKTGRLSPGDEDLIELFGGGIVYQDDTQLHDVQFGDWRPAHTAVYGGRDPGGEYVIYESTFDLASLKFGVIRTTLSSIQEFGKSDVYMGARTFSGGLSGSDRENIVSFVASKWNKRPYALTAYTALTAGKGLGYGPASEGPMYTCVGLAEAAYESIGKDIVPANEETAWPVALSPRKEFNRTVPENQCDVMVGDTVDFDVYGVYHDQKTSQGMAPASWQNIPGTPTLSVLNNNSGHFHWVVPDNSEGDYTITFGINYAPGLSDSQTITFHVRPRTCLVSNNTPCEFLDSTGDRVHLSYTGNGSAFVTFGGTNANGSDISSVTISKADGKSIFTVDVLQAAGGSNGKTPVPTVRVAGTGFKQLELDDLNGSVAIDLTGISSGKSVGSILVDGVLGSLSGPNIKQISLLQAAQIEGNNTVNVSVGKIAKLVVGGDIVDSVFSLAKGIGAATISGDVIGSQFNSNASLSKISIGGLFDKSSAMTATSTISNIKIGGDIKGTFTASKISKLGSTSGYFRDPVSGALDPCADHLVGKTITGLYDCDGPPVSSNPLLGITHYDRASEWWQYDATVSGDLGSGQGNVTISVGDSLQKIGGHTCSVVTSTSADCSVTTAWYTDAKGTHISLWDMVSSFGDMEINLNSPVIAPSDMKSQQEYSKSGSFNGTWSMNLGGLALDGTLKGKANVSSNLLGKEQVIVPAGSYAATKVLTSISLTGTVTLHYAGQTIKADFSVTDQQTSWGTDEIGIVKAADNITVSVSIPGVDSQSATINTALAMTKHGKN